MSDIAAGRVIADLYAELRAACLDSSHVWRLLWLATSQTDGPQLRQLVLRDANEFEHSLQFHTDALSAKVREIQAEPRIAMGAYDPIRHRQLRIQGVAQIHVANAYAQRRWYALDDQAREEHRQLEAPGTAITAVYRRDQYPRASLAQAFARFAVVDLRIENFELLDLDRAGHRRMRVSGLQGDAPVSQWLAP